MTDTLFLRSDEIDGLAEPADYVAAVGDGYRQRGEGAAAEPRTKLLGESPPGMLTEYAAILPESGYMGGYTYSAGFGERDAWFVTPLFDADSGEPLAILDGASMNPYKTGATGAVGVDHLARADAETVGLIGSGAQARGQLRATATVRDLTEVRVYSPTRANREAFADEMDDTLDCKVRVVGDSAAAVSDADIVITATTAAEPVFDGDRLEPGTHVTAMGQYDPDKRELDTTTIERSRYVPDLRERVEAGTSRTSASGSSRTPARSSTPSRRVSSTSATSTPSWARSSPAPPSAGRPTRRSPSSTAAAPGSKPSPPPACSTSGPPSAASGRRSSLPRLASH